MIKRRTISFYQLSNPTTIWFGGCLASVWGQSIVLKHRIVVFSGEVGQLSVIDSWSAIANNDYISSNGSRMGSGWSPLTTTRSCTMVTGGQLKLPLATEAQLLVGTDHLCGGWQQQGDGKTREYLRRYFKSPTWLSPSSWTLVLLSDSLYPAFIGRLCIHTTCIQSVFPHLTP